MDTMNLDLPESLKDFVLSQVAEGGHGSVSEYVRALIRTEQDRRVQELLVVEILKGLNSGESTPTTPEDWQNIRREVRERHAERQQG